MFSLPRARFVARLSRGKRACTRPRLEPLEDRLVVAGGFVVAQPLTVSTVTLRPVSINVLPSVEVNDGSAVDPKSVKILGATFNGPSPSPVVDAPPQGSVVVNPATGLVTYTPRFGF